MNISQLTSLLFLIYIVSTGPCLAEIYKWTDENGNTHFSDRASIQHKSQTVDVQVNTYDSVSYDASIFDTGKKVVMYSTSWCGYCKKAKTYFSKNNIPFTEYNIEKNSRAKREYKKMGATGVPVILVGKKRMNGFSQKGFEAIYR